MSICLSAGLSSGEEDDSDGKASEVYQLVDETSETGGIKGGNYMDVQKHSVEFEIQFWPVEHPMEPQDEDRPVKCPIPTSSVIKEGSVREEKYAESLRKRPEVPLEVNKDGIVVLAAEPPVRAMRKRHHTLTQGDHVRTSLTRMSSLPAQDITIFQMLQQVDRFDH